MVRKRGEKQLREEKADKVYGKPLPFAENAGCKITHDAERIVIKRRVDVPALYCFDERKVKPVPRQRGKVLPQIVGGHPRAVRKVESGTAVRRIIRVILIFMHSVLPRSAVSHCKKLQGYDQKKKCRG